jgi:hypothetical protein
MCTIATSWSEVSCKPIYTLFAERARLERELRREIDGCCTAVSKVERKTEEAKAGKVANI